MTISRREFAAACMGTAVQRTSASRQRPNFLVIFCDDLGYSDLGCFGNRMIQTPNLDRLASRGVRFTDFYSTAPVCSPSRAGLITGRCPQRFGIHHADLPESLPRYPLPASAVTVADVLKPAGYQTAHVGKWHLGEPPEAPEPRKRGFDYFFGCFGGRPSSPWIRYARSMDPEIVVNENRPVVYKGHVTEVQTQGALAWLGKVDRSRPFFLNLWYNAPHEPLAPLDNQARLYKDWSPEEQTYFQTVSDVDTCVGRVLAKLEQMGAAENTMILFTSDNGPEAHSFRYSRGSAWPLKGMKTQLWEGGIREPGILVWPGHVPSRPGFACRGEHPRRGSHHVPGGRSGAAAGFGRRHGLAEVGKRRAGRSRAVLRIPFRTAGRGGEPADGGSARPLEVLLEPRVHLQATL